MIALRRRSLAFRTLGAYVALSVVANLYIGCSTTHVDSARVSGRTTDSLASLSVAVYETVSDEHKKHPLDGPVSTRLLRDSEGALQVVQEYTSSTWSIDALPPGSYRLQIFPVAPAAGSEPKPIEKETFTLRSGEKTTIAVILKDRRGAYWTAMGIGIGAIVVAVVAAFLNSLSHTSCTTSTARAAQKAFAREQERPNAPLQPTRSARH